jgi:23S rRNA (uracil1939-C5)-methyltransferase
MLFGMQEIPLSNHARCKHASECGGCKTQHVAYEAQLSEKQARVEALFESFLKEGKTQIHPIIPCLSPWAYRNKMEFSFSQNRAGVHFLGLMLAGGRGKVLSLEECHLTAPWFAELLGVVRAWWEESGLRAYHHRSNEGSLRTLIVREGQRTGDKMVMLTVSGNPDFALTKPQIEGFTQVVKGMIPEASIFLRIQQIAKGSPTQFFEIHLSGPDHIQERLHIDDAVLTFKISPSSFFQPNTLQAEKLYSRALQMAGMQPQAHVLDLYCGTGTLGMAFALRAGRVTGVELNPYAVFDAQANAQLNQMGNIEILRGDVGALLPQLVSEAPPDLVVLDPPRSGLDPAALKHLIALAPEKILYISCNPNTQAENIRVLAEAGYQLLELQPVDQFPHTVHIENIALLRR